MKRTIFIFSITFMLLSCFFIKSKVIVRADDTPRGNRYFTSIEIREGDTLWSIAEDFHDAAGMSTKKYIRKLKEMNGLNNDMIRTGDMITILYYAEQPINFR